MVDQRPVVIEDNSPYSRHSNRCALPACLNLGGASMSRLLKHHHDLNGFAVFVNSDVVASTFGECDHL